MNIKTLNSLAGDVIYCDNAATTLVAPEVLEAFLPYLQKIYGNPSSTHYFGKQAKEAVETARKQIAYLLNASPNEIFFTAGATEANNLALTGCIQTYQIKHVITSRLEHSAVLKCLDFHQRKGNIQVHFVDIDSYGNIDYAHLESLLKLNTHALVSLMHVNNEIGNITDIEEVSRLARKYEAIFHTDTVQTIGKREFDLQEQNIDFLVASAHKFHGVKGVGFIYINQKHKIEPLIFGGSQEKGIRSGTENVAGIVALAKALALAYSELDVTQRHLATLKTHFISRLKQINSAISFNGESGSLEKSAHNIVNVSFPKLKNNASLPELFEIWGIAVSGGSACSSNHGSNVLKALNHNLGNENIRFSFSKYNTINEIDYITDKLEKIYVGNEVSALQQFQV